MEFIKIEELKEKLEAGESIEEIAKKYEVYFSYGKEPIPENIPVEKLIEIIEKAPELLTTGRNIPVWLFLLLLVREKFDLIDKIVSEIFKREKRIVRYQKEEDTSNIVVYNTLTTIKQVKKEQIIALLSILGKKRKLRSRRIKKDIVEFLIEHFLEPLKGCLSEDCFLPILAWVIKETGPYFFKHISYEFFKKLPVDSQFMQEKIVEYFITAESPWQSEYYFNKFRLFEDIENVEKINEEFFISSVVKSFPALGYDKQVYLLNFPFFTKNYPQLALESLRVFLMDPDTFKIFIIKNNKIFIPDEIWDIAIKETPSLFVNLIKMLPINTFSFNLDYVSEKAKLVCFIEPELWKEVQTRLRVLKGVLIETPAQEIIKELKSKLSLIKLEKDFQQTSKIIKFVIDNLPYDAFLWVLHNLLPSYCMPFEERDKEGVEYELGTFKPQLQETISLIDEISQTDKSSQTSKS